VIALADMAAIHDSAQPQEAAILAALYDARQIEPYGHSFTAAARWKYPVKRDEAAALAHYAYNVDVESSFDAATCLHPI
jgi:hypothetical protein